MSFIRSFICLSAICAILFCSCRKDQTDRGLLDTRYHIGFRDPLTGTKVTGLAAYLVHQPKFGIVPAPKALVEDVEGYFVYNPGFGAGLKDEYVKLVHEGYLVLLYQLNPFWLSGHPGIAQDGSGGSNVVYVDPSRNQGSEYYFQADIYRTATLELHLVQVNDYPDRPNDPRWFNATIKGTDAANAANTFGIGGIFKDGIKLSSDRKLDTVVRVSGFANYLNEIQWEVYGLELLPSGPMGEMRNWRVSVADGGSSPVNCPLEFITKMTITF